MKKRWMVGMLSILFCAVVTAVNPAQAQAATRSEKDVYRQVFDASYYYNTYPDVAAAFGMDENALLDHYVDFGAGEGRSASVEFNVQAYRQRYSDLQSAFGSDMTAYCRHYVAYGRSEGRNGSSDGQTMVSDGASVEANNVTKTTSAPLPQQASGSEIGTYTTYYQDNVPRADNVELAAAKINGVIVQPGAGFSFSGTLGPRTTANGYVEAPIFISGKTGMGIGGGICQVSSTLYAAMVSAGLPATERHAHSLRVDYLPAGLDATIAGNYKDLKFTNIYSQPLLIQASAEGGQVTVTLVLQ